MYSCAFYHPHPSLFCKDQVDAGFEYLQQKVERSSTLCKKIYEFSVAQVDRALARRLGGHRFESCRGLRFFLCPTIVTC